MNVLKDPTTDPAATAGAIAKDIRIDGAAEMQVVGRAANQAVKASHCAELPRSDWDGRALHSPASPPFGSTGMKQKQSGRASLFRACPRHDLRAPTARTVTE